MRRALLLLTVAAAVASTASGSLASSRSVLPLHRDGRIAFAHLQQVAPPGVMAISATGERRSLLLPGELQEPPVFSPDGSRVACVAGRSAPMLYVARTDGTQRRWIAAGRSPTWSPDGSRIAYVLSKTGGIVTTAVDGSGGWALGVAGFAPVWSPDGRWIAFFSSDGALELIRPDGSEHRVVAPDAYTSYGGFDDALGRAAWSFDGSWLAFGAVDPERHVLELNVARPDGSERRSLGNGSGVAWSPVEDLIAFTTSIDGSTVFELVGPDGSVRLRSQTLDGTPAWSRDGHAVALGNSELKGIAVLDARTGAVSMLPLDGVPAWSRDGRRIAAVAGGSLGVVDAAGGRARRITRGVAWGAAGPTWLRGGRVAYTTLARVRSVVETRAEGAASRIVLRGPTSFTPTPHLVRGLAWSPDGSLLAFTREVAHGTELGIVAPGGRVQILARGASGPLSWSPDGSRIAFEFRGLHVVAVRGGAPRRLTPLGESPDWAPDGRRIAFLRDEINDGAALYVVDPSGRHLRKLVAGLSSPPLWAPDGQRIAFSTGAPYEPTAIATIRPDGRGFARLVSAPAAEETGDVLSEPSWSPDGRTILYYDEAYLCGSKCSEISLVLMRSDGTQRRRLAFSIAGASWSPSGTQLLGQDGEGRLVAVDLRSGRGRFEGGFASAWSWQSLPDRALG